MNTTLAVVKIALQQSEKTSLGQPTESNQSDGQAVNPWLGAAQNRPRQKSSSQSIFNQLKLQSGAAGHFDPSVEVFSLI